ncbi:MAG: type III-B CRISPR module RAMP protein Cmr1 [candidate division WOR-3 bacterium]
MKKISLSCKIITPLFMGGAEQQAELRTQSFNGLFRYWFRLLGGSFEDEKRLFGWGGEKANKGVVRIRVIKEGDINPYQVTHREPTGYRYLGFSLQLTERNGIKVPYYFKILFSFHPIATDEDIKKFLCAVWCAFYLGNFGSRSRRGFGSIMVEDIEGDIPSGFNLKFKPQGDIGNWIKEQLNYIKGLNYWKARKDIPYVFENLEIYRFFQSKRYCFEMLHEMGTRYRYYRQNLRFHERIWFGLPILPKIKEARRASLLIFKTIQSNSNFEGFILVFKPNEKHDFKFLPDEAKINLKGVNLNMPRWEVLNDFMRSLENLNLIKKIYPSKEVEL